jgi:AcrR family transcriptional regulator
VTQPGSGPRRGRPTNFAVRRAEIVDSAVAEIIAHGVAGMTHANVAARLGLTPTAVAYYFRSREDLAVAALRSTTDALGEITRDAMGAAGDGDVLDRLVSASLRFSRDVRRGDRRPAPPPNDLRGLDHPEINASYNEVVRTIAALLAGEVGERRPFRYGRAVFVMANLPWPPNHWVNGWRLTDLDLAGHHIADLLRSGFLPAAADVAGLAPETRPLERPHTPQEEFLVAATRAINSQGYRGASVERIAANVNVTKTALYGHHASKDDLVRDCFRRTFEILWDTVDRAEAGGGDGATRLVRFCAEVLSWQFGDAPLLRMTALSTLPDVVGREPADELQRLKVRIGCLLSDGVADRSLRPINPLIGSEYLSLALSSGSTIRFWHPNASPGDAARAYLLMVMKGAQAG